MKTLLSFLMLASASFAQSISAVQVSSQQWQITGTGAKSAAILKGPNTNTALLADSSGNFTGIIGASLGLLVATNQDGTAIGSVNLVNAAPTVQQFTITDDGFQLTLSGIVADDAPMAGLVVSFSSPGPNINGINGNLAQVVWLPTMGVHVFTKQLPGRYKGTITATVTDWYGATGSRVALIP